MTFREIVTKLYDKLKADYEEKQKRIQEYYMRYSRLSDEALFQRFKTGSEVQRAACAKLLRERGYGHSDD